MPHILKKLENSQIELTITVSPENYEKYLEVAGKRLAERASIKGFRPGKVPLDVLKKEVGEMAILQEALEDIVQTSYYEAVTSEKLDTIGMPKISIDKLAPGNDVAYKATVSLLPKVILPNIKNIKVEKKVKKIEDKHIDEVIDSIRKMQAVEVIKNDKKSSTEDKLIIDMDMFLDKVPVEGGAAKDYQVYLSEPHYIPGFNDQLIGLGQGEEKEFSLDFPPTHYQKHLAGKNVQIKVKVKDIYERQLPEISDELAKKIGQEDLAKLRELINANLLHEAEEKADQQVEIEILEKLITDAKFEVIPEVLIDAERHKIFYELKHDLERHGINIEQYLADLKKTQEEMFKDFSAQAEKRAKAALISRQVANEQGIHVHDEELQKEIKVMEEMYKDNKDYLANLKKPEVKDTISMTLQNRKVMQWLKATALGEPIPEGIIHEHHHDHE
ncbi:MAG: Trigger factor [Candidatus Magasanikbacteria bacterium GW2011_GWC2_37_14]|uniref:Trigger factor n=1 Tax=Candidatus Magasanikbacteria bacterium GW2011_GWC2_37_14 TaxID=1619046 RepID=A0A0G0JHE2_9BACT|nr:MAG: Trigger factor [Candidatus Magasanikbacteria bacterium GW2011_GWC2_37_14]